MAEPTKMQHPSVEERRARGKAARQETPLVQPRSSGSRPQTAPTPSPCSRSRTRRREPDLVPVRHGRMMVSPFTFYRGAARIMAADLKDTPRAGLTVQLCGDAHLSNFGAFASPERNLLFDLNDFDETLPGPFEYDVERLAASFTIAARNNGFSKADAREATLTVGARLPAGDGRVRADARHGHLVLPPHRGGTAGGSAHHGPRTGHGEEEGEAGRAEAREARRLIRDRR